VTLASYGGNPTFASTTTVSVTLPPRPGGVAYINVHLDYGLKGTTGYAKDGNNNAIDAMSLAMRIPDKQAYPFSDSNGGSDSTPCCAEIRPTRNARKIGCSSRTTSHSRVRIPLDSAVCGYGPLTAELRYPRSSGAPVRGPGGLGLIPGPREGLPAQ